MLCGSQRARLLNLSAAGSTDGRIQGVGVQGAVLGIPTPWMPVAHLLPLVATEVSRSLVNVPERVREGRGRLSPAEKHRHKGTRLLI